MNVACVIIYRCDTLSQHWENRVSKSCTGLEDLAQLTAIRRLTHSGRLLSRSVNWASDSSSLKDQVCCDKCRQRSLRHLTWFTECSLSLPRLRSARRRMLRSRFVLNEMRTEIMESTAATSHEFAIAFSYYLLASALVVLNCSFLKGPTETS